MPVHRSHDRPYPTAPRADELPNGLHEPEQACAGPERDEHGRWCKGCRTAQSRGGRSKRDRSRLATLLGLSDLLVAPGFKPYLAASKDFADAEVARLGAAAGGGECGPGPASIVASAALQLAASRYLFDQAAAEGAADLFAQASRLADASRNNLLSAFELPVKEAKSRPRQSAADRLSAQIAARRALPEGEK